MSRVMVVVFFGWTFFMLLFDIASGDVCLACADAPVTRACHYTRTCESHESCYADAFVNANGDTIFDMGCRDKHICGPSGKREVANRSNGNTLLCTQCCTGNICNAALCGQIGLPPAGPVCFQCDQASTPSTCNTIALCGRDDVCYVEKTIDALSHDTLYKSGCMHKIQCDKRAQLVGRKRYDSTVMSGNDLQVQCCDSYLCNHGNTSTTLGSPLTSGTVAPAYGSLSTNPTLCSRSPCLHGNCFSGSADYFCKCEQGWQGKNCDQSGQGPCSRAPCVHGNCFESSIDYVCQCTNGWTGKNCDQIHPTNPPVTIAHGTPTATPGVTSRTPTVTATPYRTTVTATATGVPPACIGDWSSWINTDTPDGDGDIESWSAAQKAVFCPMGKVTSIECATVDGIASYSTGEIQQCTLETGSRCMNDDNFPVPCSDYKIRYYCDCKVQPTLPATVGSNTPTLTPSGFTQTAYKQLTTSQTPLPCTSLWSSWINKDKPDTGDGDRESWTAAQRLAFCPAGKITAVECQTVDGIASYSTGEVAQCSIEGGSVCLTADNDPIPCSDYQIRYYCTCEAQPSQKPTIGVTPSTTRLPPRISAAPTTSHGHGHETTPHGHGHETAVPCLTRWGRWINRDLPDSGPGDREVMTQHELSTFCAGGRISAIECQTVDGIPSYSTGEMISCTINNGLECRNDDNAPMPCSDYKIRYNCECEQAPPMVTTGSPMALHRTPMHINECEFVTCPVAVRPVVKEGEEVQEVLSTDGCCRKYIVACNPILCTPAALQCPPPMYMVPATLNDCCPTFQCTCPPVCPTMTKPMCGEGMEVVIIASKCNCTAYACARRPPVTSTVCEYVMNNKTHTYNIGQSWHDGLCKFCTCTDRPEGAVTSCEEERCPKCKLGFKIVPRADQCCDHCEEIGCVVNGTVYKAGEYIPSTRDCFTKACNFDANLKMFIVSETQVMCPKYDLLRECLESEETYDLKGCCMRCVPKPVRNNTENLTCQTCAPRLISGQPNDTIGYFTVMDNLELCKNNEPITDLLECSGYCSSRSLYGHVMRGYTNDCNCCKATATESRTVELTCKGGRKLTKTYSVPKSCGCGICTGGK